ncbi:MAG: hypothetical protein JNM56_08655 [Planctomycetia bacterium]|nr:hypothetical protein [Planctomycetia bacterium]
MRRLIPVLCLLACLPGCGGSGKPSGDAAKTVEGTRPVLADNAPPAQIAEAYLIESWKGSQCDIMAVKELATTLRGKLAVAVHIQWKLKGDDELRHDLLIVQEGRVKDLKPYDATRSLEDNATSAVKQLEAP